LCILEGDGGERQLVELLAQSMALPIHRKGLMLFYLFKNILEGREFWKGREARDSWLNCWPRAWLCLSTGRDFCYLFIHKYS